LGLILTGCNSFLDGSGLKNQLDEKIEEAKSEKSVLYFEVDNNYGSFLSTASVEISKGNEIEIQFSWNKDNYKFNGFYITDYETKLELNSVIDLPEISEAESVSGLYKTVIKIKDSSRSVVLRPKCYTKNDNICPVVENVELYTVHDTQSPFYRKLTSDFNPEFFDCFKKDDLKNLTTEQKSLFHQNHVNKLNLKVSVSDNNNEISRFKIRETLVKKVDTTDVSESTSQEISYYTV